MEVLAVASRAVADACERLGLDVERLLADAGMTRAALASSDARIDAALADRVWELAYARAGDPFLALHAAEALPFGAYKVIDYLGAHSETIGEAVRRVVAYFPIVDARARFELDEAGEPIALSMFGCDGPVPGPGQDYTFAALATRVRAMAGTALRLAGVDFTYGAPADRSEHARIFAAPLRFGQPVARMLWPRSIWQSSLQGRDPALVALLEQHASAILRELAPRSAVATRARDALIEAIRAQREPSVQSVARTLATSVRTLQRNLRDEGSSFASLLDDARAATARAYLHDPALSLAEIAWLLGFSDQSTFSRAFKRWTGATPGAFRASPEP
ncbi:MAG: AraC family transcriptional regulator [Sandaracinaceae bacterium]|nr:AraC family transcriptional regulator [Sandaracinaceae bacterium]